MTEPNQREKRHAALYFSPRNSKAFKELAARIRSDGGRTTLVWANQWKGAENILTECRAIVLEDGCAHMNDIIEAYRRYAVDCEIHIVDSDGEFKEEDDLTAVDGLDGRAASNAGLQAGEIIADEEAQASRDERGATKEEDEAALAAEVGATDEEEHADQDAETDAAVEAEEAEGGEDAGDSDGDGEDAGTEDEGGEEGSEEPTDKG